MTSQLILKYKKLSFATSRRTDFVLTNKQIIVAVRQRYGTARCRAYLDVSLEDKIGIEDRDLISLDDARYSKYLLSYTYLHTCARARPRPTLLRSHLILLCYSPTYYLASLYIILFTFRGPYWYTLWYTTLSTSLYSVFVFRARA